MALKEAIRDSPEFQAQTSQNGNGGGQSTTQNQGQTPGQVPAGTVVSLEKSDLEFWLQVATVFLLYSIYRELQRGSR